VIDWIKRRNMEPRLHLVMFHWQMFCQLSHLRYCERTRPKRQFKNNNPKKKLKFISQLTQRFMVIVQVLDSTNMPPRNYEEMQFGCWRAIVECYQFIVLGKV
jgi:hypothetical protein